MRPIVFIFLSIACPAVAALADTPQKALESAMRRQWQQATQHAQSADDPALDSLLQWQYALDPDSGATFDEIKLFLQEHPDWPLQSKLRVRAELAMKDAALTDSDIQSFFSTTPPFTGIGKILLAEAKMKNGAAEGDVASLLREGWINGDFDELREKAIRARHAALLGNAEDIARTDRLLWESRTTAARRMLPLLPTSYRHLFEARIALIEDKKSVSVLLSQVPASLKHDAGLTYDRMQYRARRDDKLGVREMLLIAPLNPPYPQKWWRQRELQVRRAIDENNIRLAKQLLVNHGQSEGAEFADATWLLGWLELQFLRAPEKALVHFELMYNAVKFPVSRGRAAYWAARAAAAAKPDMQQEWLRRACRYSTTFYGQLACRELGIEKIAFDRDAKVGDDERRRFEQSLLARAARVAIRYGGLDLASRLIGLAIENAESEAQAIFFAQIGAELSQDFLSVRAAKKLHQQFGVALEKEGYPRPKTPENLPIERALALAIARQESEFDPLARSPSGALGMMQLLPSTARETAKKLQMAYSNSDLHEPMYNMTLGSHYLRRMIDSYSGSYIMAIAAYNAGPGNVRNWSNQFGTPGNTLEGAIDWIEKIPFAETRNYVQRVLENLQVYRQLENEKPKLSLTEDMVR